VRVTVRVSERASESVSGECCVVLCCVDVCVHMSNPEFLRFWLTIMSFVHCQTNAI